MTQPGVGRVQVLGSKILQVTLTDGSPSTNSLGRVESFAAPSQGSEGLMHEFEARALD